MHNNTERIEINQKKKRETDVEEMKLQQQRCIKELEIGRKGS